MKNVMNLLGNMLGSPGGVIDVLLIIGIVLVGLFLIAAIIYFISLVRRGNFSRQKRNEDSEEFFHQNRVQPEQAGQVFGFEKREEPKPAPVLEEKKPEVEKPQEETAFGDFTRNQIEQRKAKDDADKKEDKPAPKPANKNFFENVDTQNNKDDIFPTRKPNQPPVNPNQRPPQRPMPPQQQPARDTKDLWATESFAPQAQPQPQRPPAQPQTNPGQNPFMLAESPKQNNPEKKSEAEGKIEAFLAEMKEKQATQERDAQLAREKAQQEKIDELTKALELRQQQPVVTQQDTRESAELIAMRKELEEIRRISEMQSQVATMPQSNPELEEMRKQLEEMRHKRELEQQRAELMAQYAGQQQQPVQPVVNPELEELRKQLEEMRKLQEAQALAATQPIAPQPVAGESAEVTAMRREMEELKKVMAAEREREQKEKEERERQRLFDEQQLKYTEALRAMQEANEKTKAALQAEIDALAKRLESEKDKGGDNYFRLEKERELKETQIQRENSEVALLQRELAKQMEALAEEREEQRVEFARMRVELMEEQLAAIQSQKEIIKEVEVIKEVEIEVPVEVIKEIEVIREVEVPVEVIKEVEVEVERIVEVEVPNLELEAQLEAERAQLAKDRQEGERQLKEKYLQLRQELEAETTQLAEREQEIRAEMDRVKKLEAEIAKAKRAAKAEIEKELTERLDYEKERLEERLEGESRAKLAEQSAQMAKLDRERRALEAEKAELAARLSEKEGSNRNDEEFELAKAKLEMDLVEVRNRLDEKDALIIMQEQSLAELRANPNVISVVDEAKLNAEIAKLEAERVKFEQEHRMRMEEVSRREEELRIREEQITTTTVTEVTAGPLISMSASLTKSERQKLLIEYRARLEELRTFLRENERAIRNNNKEFVPLRRIRDTLERDTKLLRKREAIVAKQQVLVYGVNNIANLDPERVKKLEVDVQQLTGLQQSVAKCEDIMHRNRDRFPTLENLDRVLKSQHSQITVDITRYEEAIVFFESRE